MTTETEREVLNILNHGLDIMGESNVVGLAFTRKDIEIIKDWQARAALDQRQGWVMTDEMALKVSCKYLEQIAEIKRPSHLPADQLEQLHIDAMRVALQSIVPPVKVPDERPTRRADGSHIGNLCDASYNEGWNACREAMLAAAPEYKP